MRVGARRRVAVTLAILSAGWMAAGAARAADEEIQVYEDDMDKPHQFGLDVHLNYVFANTAPLDYAGEQPSAYRVRVTPEWSYGLTQNIELGAYLPLTTFRDNRYNVDGAKVRIKYIAPKADSQDWYWGLNFEIGKVDREVDINPWNAEGKAIVGWRKGRWDLAFNTNFDFVVSGPRPTPVSIQLATKIDYKVTDKLALGVESYDGAGDFEHPGRFTGSGLEIYATADASLGKWDFNMGVGRGYSGEPDQWTLKLIVSAPIDN